MKIVNRKDFLDMPENTVYMTKIRGVNDFGSLEVKVSSTKDGWGNDWIADSFFVFMDKPFDDCGTFPELGDEFRFEENQNTRDGLFENEQLFAVFDNQDIQQVIDKLKRCLK